MYLLCIKIILKKDNKVYALATLKEYYKKSFLIEENQNNKWKIVNLKKYPLTSNKIYRI